VEDHSSDYINDMKASAKKDTIAIRSQNKQQNNGSTD
jgi:hypothetical protein